VNLGFVCKFVEISFVLGVPVSFLVEILVEFLNLGYFDDASFIPIYCTLQAADSSVLEL